MIEGLAFNVNPFLLPIVALVDIPYSFLRQPKE